MHKKILFPFVLDMCKKDSNFLDFSMYKAQIRMRDGNFSIFSSFSGFRTLSSNWKMQGTGIYFRCVLRGKITNVLHTVINSQQVMSAERKKAETKL